MKRIKIAVMIFIIALSLSSTAHASPLSTFKVPLPSFVKPGLKLYYNVARSAREGNKSSSFACVGRLYVIDVLNQYQAVAILTLYSPNHTSPPIINNLILGGACDFWINPAYTKTLDRPDLGINITPGRINVNQRDQGYLLEATFDPKSGLITGSMERTRTANGEAKNVMTYTNYSWGTPPAWVRYSPPSWLQPGRTLIYEITYGVMGNPMPGGSLMIRIDSVQGKLISATITNPSNPVGEKKVFYVNGYWQPPLFLKTLQTGAILDDDKILNLREYVLYRDPSKVVIALQGGSMIWAKGTFATDSGAMINGEINLVAGGSMFLTLRGFR